MDLISREDAVKKLCKLADRMLEPYKSHTIMIALFIQNVEEFPTIMSGTLEEAVRNIRNEITEYKDDLIIHAERNEMIDIVLEIIDKHMKEVDE